MKAAFKEFLSAFGLAPATQVERMTKDTQDAAVRIAQLEERLAQARADAESWKRRHGESTEALAGWKQSADAQDLRARLQSSRAKLEEAERAATTANEHLMAMEVKLDLLEAAIRVLDVRTRDQVVPRASRPKAVGADR